jgi:hypothetical protein
MTGVEADGRERRQMQAAINQSAFREVNESLEKLNQDFSQIIPVGDFVCECADTECTARIGLTIAEYEQLRSVPTHFAVRHGHVVPDAERVVEEHVGYLVVEKFEAAADYATSVDPRARSSAT